MLKDIILATILGALLGFGLTGGYFAVKKSPPIVTNANQSFVTPTISISSDNSPEPSPTPDLSTQSNQIIVTSPQNQSIVANSKVTLKGSTSPSSYLVVTTPIKSYYSQSDSAGNFVVDVEIDSGANLIGLSSFDQQDVQATATILITYSTAKL